MRHVKQYPAVFAIMFAFAACASVAEQDRGFVQSAPNEEATLYVRNEYLTQTDVYAIAGSARVKLGTVKPGDGAQLRVPRTFVDREDVQFQLDPVGSEQPYTLPPIAVWPASSLQLTVASRLSLSTVMSER